MIIDEAVRVEIGELCEFAAEFPIDMPTRVEEIKTPEGVAAHMAQMRRQTMRIPLGFEVTFSIEHGHPAGNCRHLSVSIDREGRVPSPVAVWTVAQEFGFNGDQTKCRVWLEDLRGGGKAVNVVQPLDFQP